MLKNKSEMKCIVNGKDYMFTCEMDSSTLDVKLALCHFIKVVGQIEDSHAEKMKAEQELSQEQDDSVSAPQE